MLKGKTALVTGSVRGIGETTARALAEQGCNIMLNGLGEPDEIEATRRRIENDFGVTAKYDGADLAHRDQVEDLVKSTQDAFGGLDILINNAVIRYYRKIVDFDPAAWDHALAVNLTAPFDLVRLALPGMIQSEWGRIVSMSSVLGLSGRSGRVDYTTTKTALLGLTRAIAAETLQYPNITCNAICPGSVLTPFIRARIQGIADERGVSWDEMAVEYRRDLGQHTDFIAPERVSATIVYLCSDIARDINGVGIPIDSGLSNTWSESPLR
jgi:3-hydroxybutyrate dehydrogenase